MTSFILLSLLWCSIWVPSLNGKHVHWLLSGTTSVETAASTTTSWTTPDTGSCAREYSCVNCTAARLCAPVPGGQSLHEIDRYSCPSSTPWCDPDTGSCTTDKPSACHNDVPALVGNFTCMRDGFFPDPDNCSVYYNCETDVPFMYECGNNSYYSPYYQACNYDFYYLCANYYEPCNGKTGRRERVNRMMNMFFDCVDGQPITVDRCIGAYVFDEYAQACLPNCTYPGLYPSDEDCTKYYQCSFASSAPAEMTLIMTDLTCPEGQGFSEQTLQCVDKSNVPNCNVKYPALFN